MHREQGFTRVDVVMLVVVGFVSYLLLQGHARLQGCRVSHEATCRSNLKTLALAAMSYADERRSRFQHIGALETLDGGYKSNTAARAARSLVYFNLIDSPETFVCPRGLDVQSPQTYAARTDPRAFRWNASWSDPPTVRPSPLSERGVAPGDLPLCDMTTLSYGWTRRGLTTSSNANVLLAADKSREIEAPPESEVARAHSGNMKGNHRKAQFAVCVDGHVVRRVPGDGGTTRISSTEPGGDALGVLGDDPELGQ